MSAQQTEGAAGRIELVQLMDPVEGAFTITLPRGWRNDARSVRPYGVHRTLVTSQSPDGGTFLFFGDPQLPTFLEPAAQTYPGMGVGPLSQVHPFVSAEPFFLRYVEDRHGRAPGFRLLSVTPCPELEGDVARSAKRYGMQARPTAVSLTFEYMDGPRRVRARLHGMTSTTGPIWVPGIFGALTTEDLDPARWDALLFAISRSQQTEPRWRQLQDQQHLDRMGQINQDHANAMAQMQRQHQANMSWIQSSMQAHLGRMNNLHAAADAQMQGWQAQQAAGEGAHGRFVNYIKGQETVLDGAGVAYQVEAGYERYYRNRHDGTYIGTSAAVSRDELRARYGLDPDDYEELRVRR